MYASEPSRRSSRLRSLFVAALLGTGLCVQAADRDQEQVKRLKLQMRQIQQEQAAQAEAQSKALADKAALEQSLKSTKAEANATKSAAASAAKRAAALNVEIQSLKADKNGLTEQIAQLQKQLEDQKIAMQRQADQAKGELSEHKGQYDTLAAQYDQCKQDNAELYKLGSDVLTRYENKGLGEVLYAKEPLIQMGRVKLENLVSAYRDKLDAARTQQP